MIAIVFTPVIYKKNSRLNENSTVLTGLICAKPQMCSLNS